MQRTRVRTRTRSGGLQWFKSSAYLADGISPSLIMDFKNNRYYSNGSARALSDLLTFTRASTATYIRNGIVYNAAVNEARIGTNGLLMEISRTNLVPYSQQLDTWSKTLTSVTADTTTAPDGTTTAEKVIATAVSASHYMYRSSISCTAASTYTLSVFAKAGEYSNLTLFLPITSYVGVQRMAWFNLSTGTVGATESGVTARIQALANGWYRCSISATADTTSSGAPGFALGTETAGVNEIFTGDGSSGLYLWGAQLEAGTQMSSYIPTTTAAVTRSADEAISTTVAEYGGGSGAQNWFLHSAGTALFKYYFDVIQSANDTTNFTIGSGIAGNYITSWENKATGYPTIRYSEATVQIDVTAASGLRTNADNIGAIAYAANNGAVAFNGGAPTTDATVTIVASGMTQFNIGSATARASVGAMGTREYPFFAFYPARISNSELTRITT